MAEQPALLPRLFSAIWEFSILTIAMLATSVEFWKCSQCNFGEIFNYNFPARAAFTGLSITYQIKSKLKVELFCFILSRLLYV